ncbi:MAG: RNA polymerase sigma factor [Anaerolineae bacterium]
MNKRELIRRAKTYDSKALAEIHTRYSRQIYDHVYRWTGDRSLAEDLTADVFMRFLETISSVDSQTSLQTWLYRIAGHLVIEHQRRQPSQSETPSEDTQNSELRQVIRRLPADQQQVLILKLVEELSNDEIAQILGTTEDSLKELQHRALIALRRLMAD